MKRELFIGDRIELYSGDSLQVLRALPPSSVDSIVTDPPYGLEFMGKEWDTFTGAGMSKPGIGERNIEWPSFLGSNTKRCRSCGLLVGHGGSPCRCKEPDAYNAALPRTQAFGQWCEEWAILCFRVLKPGGHLVAFGGTRTYHRLASGIEDAGFEIRDMLSWLYGSGFPKSRNIGEGWGTALKPACEPVCFGRKPLIGTVAANVLEHGTGAINIDGCRVHGEDAQGGAYTVKRLKPGATLNETGGNWRPEEGGIEYHGNMKPGRWPANIIHDGSAEVLEAFPQTETNAGTAQTIHRAGMWGIETQEGRKLSDGDSGSAARFFYTAKADADDRIGSKHPTVKPVDLMQWLVRLVTPKGGTVLDPFAGTGTTGEAAFREGMRAVLIEREPEYQEDIRRRMALVMAGPEERSRESIKAKLKDKPIDAGPLFEGIE